MGAIASQITSLTIVYSTVYSDADQIKKSKLRVTGLSPETGEFPAKMATNAENVSIWWRHHVLFYWSPHKYIMSHQIWTQVGCALLWYGYSMGSYRTFSQEPWWCHQGESTGDRGFPSQRPVTRSYDVFFDLRLNKGLSKQPRGR